MSLPLTALAAPADRDAAASAHRLEPRAVPRTPPPADADGDSDAHAARAVPADGNVGGSLRIGGVSVRFELDRELGEMVVKVVDPASGEPIRQIPSEEAIHIAKVMGRLRGLLVRHAA